MDVDALCAGIVVAQLQSADLGGSQAGVIRQPEDGAIARRVDHPEQPVDLLEAEKRRLAPPAVPAFRLDVWRLGTGLWNHPERGDFGDDIGH